MKAVRNIINEDAPYLLSIMHKYGEITGEPWFSFKVATISTDIEPLVRALEIARKPTEREVALEKAKDSLLQKYAIKDSNGNAQKECHELPDGRQVMQYILGDKESEYNTAYISMVESDFSDVPNITTERIKKYNEILKTETKIETMQLNASEIPKELMKGNDLKILMRNNLLEWDLVNPVVSVVSAVN